MRKQEIMETMRRNRKIKQKHDHYVMEWKKMVRKLKKRKIINKIQSDVKKNQIAKRR